MLHLLLEQRVRAHHQQRLARGEPRRAAPGARRGGVAPVSVATSTPAASARRASAGGVLAREDLGGRHERHLVAGLDRVRGGQQRHHGLAAAHVADHQPVHRPRPRAGRPRCRRPRRPGPSVSVNGSAARTRSSSRPRPPSPARGPPRRARGGAAPSPSAAGTAPRTPAGAAPRRAARRRPGSGSRAAPRPAAPAGAAAAHRVGHGIAHPVGDARRARGARAARSVRPLRPLVSACTGTSRPTCSSSPRSPSITSNIGLSMRRSSGSSSPLTTTRVPGRSVRARNGWPKK